MKKRKKRGFTLVELLVVIAIIALLMGILMPALAKVRQIAYRMVCGTNLSGIGKAMLLYSNDYDEDYPCGGKKNSQWSSEGSIQAWNQPDVSKAFSGTDATITSSFYLLVKQVELPTKQFVCKGDIGTTEFKLSDETLKDKTFELIDGWDFGGIPGRKVSYAYHIPFNEATTILGFPVSAVSNPASPVCADRNPYLDENAVDYIDGGIKGEEPPKWDDSEGEGRYTDKDKTGNSACHQRDGQNVLFNDGHIGFMLFPNCGIESDNIWKDWESYDPESKPSAKQKEIEPEKEYEILLGGWGPKHWDDAWLVNEDNE